MECNSHYLVARCRRRVHGGVHLLADQVRAPTSSAAGGPRPNPGWLVPGDLPFRRRHVRSLPVPDVLHAADPRVQPDHDRPRIHADGVRNRDSGNAFDSGFAAARRSASADRERNGHRGDRNDSAGQISVDSTYAVHILPGLVVTGLGMGSIFAPSMQGATSGVHHEDAGVASATVNTMQQVGGSIGTALLSTIAASASTNYLVAAR